MRTGLLVTLIFYASFSTLVWLLQSPWWMAWCEPEISWSCSLPSRNWTCPCDLSQASRQELRVDTVKYIRWEMVAAVIQGLERFTHVVFVLLKRDKVILAMTLLQALLTVFFDYLFVSDLPGSLRVGVIGLAWSNICTLAYLGISWYVCLLAGVRFPLGMIYHIEISG